MLIDNIPLSLKGNTDYAQTVLSYYLWRQATPPDRSVIADEKFIRPDRDEKGEPISYINFTVDAEEYMEEVGKNLSIARQIMFQLFFNLTTKDDSKRKGARVTLDQITSHGTLHLDTGEIILSHEEFIKLFYDGSSKEDNARDAVLTSDQYTTDTSDADYWKRAFVFGSTKYQLDINRVEYVFDAQTGEALRIQNIFVKPENDNFDFISSDKGIGEAMGSVLSQIMDFNGIGRSPAAMTCSSKSARTATR